MSSWSGNTISRLLQAGILFAAVLLLMRVSTALPAATPPPWLELLVCCGLIAWLEADRRGWVPPPVHAPGLPAPRAARTRRLAYGALVTPIIAANGALTFGVLIDLLAAASPATSFRAALIALPFLALATVKIWQLYRVCTAHYACTASASDVTPTTIDTWFTQHGDRTAGVLLTGMLALTLVYLWVGQDGALVPALFEHPPAAAPCGQALTSHAAGFTLAIIAALPACLYMWRTLPRADADFFAAWRVWLYRTAPLALGPARPFPWRYVCQHMFEIALLWYLALCAYQVQFFFADCARAGYAPPLVPAVRPALMACGLMPFALFYGCLISAWLRTLRSLSDG